MYTYEKEQEPALIRRACRGDVKAFSELYARIYKDLYQFALVTMKHPQDAEDVVSEAVLAAYENIHKLRKEASFRSWIFTILANKCRAGFRKQEMAEELPEEIAAQERDYAGNYDVREAFMQLKEEDRLIVACSVLAGYSSEQIGKMLEMSAATVRSRKARALERMRQSLG